MNLDRLKKSITEHEGGNILMPYRVDGLLHIGIGRCLDRIGISREEGEFMFSNDMKEALTIFQKLPWMKNLDDLRQEVLVEMAYQMGVDGVLQFRKMLAALQRNAYKEAAVHGADSLWMKQTPSRSKELMRMLETGVEIK